MLKQWCHQKCLPTCVVKQRQHLCCQIVMAANNIYTVHSYLQHILFSNQQYEKLMKLLSWKSPFLSLSHWHCCQQCFHFFLRDLLQSNQTLCPGWGFLKLLSLSNVSMNFISVHKHPAEAANLCCFDGLSHSLYEAQSTNTCKTSLNTCPLNIANASAKTLSWNPL